MSKYESISLRNKIMISMDIDELILGGLSREEVLDFKTIAKQIFQAGGFKLPKLHCNCELEFEDASIKTLEESPKVITHGDCNDTTYVKQQLGTQPSEEDSIATEIPSNKARHTKWEIRSNPLGLILPAHLWGKVVYQETCELSCYGTN